MTQQYGTVKVDFITFTSGTTGNETDITIPVSGLADIAESGINISGDITGRNITATGNLSVSGQAFFASGIETAPSISFVDDTDTGFYNAAANEVRITTSGNDRLTVDESGNVGIGTSDPHAVLKIASGASRGTSSKEVARFECNTNGSLRGISISAPGDVNGIGKIAMENTNYPMQFWTGTTSAARVTILSSGNVGIGTSSPAAKFSISNSGENGIEFNPNLQIFYVKFRGFYLSEKAKNLRCLSAYIFFRLNLRFVFYKRCGLILTNGNHSFSVI